MATSSPVKKLTKSQAKRAQFKSCIEDLNDCVGDGVLTHNEILEKSVAAIKLDSFYSQSSEGMGDTYELMQGVPHNDKRSVDVNQFLKVLNSFGIGFLDTGMIVYTTDQLIKYFIDVKYLDGHPLSTICFNSAQVIKSVFEHNKTEFVLEMKGNYRATAANNVCISGKKMLSAKNKAMFLGYSKIKPFSMLKNPLMSVDSYQGMINPYTMQIMKSDKRMESLLNCKIIGSAAGGHPHQDDISKLMHAMSTLHTTGFAEFTLRLIRNEADGSSRYIHTLTKQHLFKTGPGGETRIAVSAWPFAITKDGYNFTDNDVVMLNNSSLGNEIKKQTRQYRNNITNREGIFCEEPRAAARAVVKEPVSTVHRYAGVSSVKPVSKVTAIQSLDKSKTVRGTWAVPNPNPKQVASSSSVTMPDPPITGPLTVIHHAVRNKPPAEKSSSTSGVQHTIRNKSAFSKVQPKTNFLQERTGKYNKHTAGTPPANLMPPPANTEPVERPRANTEPVERPRANTETTGRPRANLMPPPAQNSLTFPGRSLLVAQNSVTPTREAELERLSFYSQVLEEIMDIVRGN